MGEAPQNTISAARAQGANPDPRAAIARASRATGMDFPYLVAQARLESSLDPTARARTSSAAGLYQFTQGTWLETLDRHGADHGLGWAQDAITGKRVRDPALRGQIMALRFDADASALMAAELAGDNRDGLRAQLGREPDHTELYLAHFLGLGGAGRFLTALAADPGQSASALMPQAAAANRGIFYDGKSPRSVGQVMDLLRSKMAAAGAEGGSNAIPPLEPAGTGSHWAQALPNGQFPSASQALSGNVGTSPQAAPRPSMSDTLRDSFGLASASSGGAAPAFVREAYGKLRSFGL